MRGFYTFLFVVGFVFFVEPVFGQVEGDTLGLTGGMEDTVVARRLLLAEKILAKNQKFNEAFSMADSASGIWSRTLGSEHLEVANANFEKGIIRHAQSKYQEAISWFDKSLEILEKKKVKNDSLISLLYYHKCRTYRVKGDLQKSLESGNKSLNIRIAIFGQEHNDVASAYNYLGNVYNSLGDYKKSTDCYLKSINIRIKLFGETRSR
jgi:tetratricopeptide (TPR) repeat protein